MLAALAFVGVALVVATAFACVFKQQRDQLRQQRDGYEMPTTPRRGGQRGRTANSGTYMDVV